MKLIRIFFYQCVAMHMNVCLNILSYRGAVVLWLLEFKYFVLSSAINDMGQCIRIFILMNMIIH